MKKITFTLLVFICTFATVFTSCSKNEESTIITGNTSYYDGEYSGERFNLTIDGNKIINAKALIKFGDANNFKVTLSGVPSSSKDIEWDATINENNAASGEFKSPDGTSYSYTLSFDGLYGIVQLSIICKSIQ